MMKVLSPRADIVTEKHGLMGDPRRGGPLTPCGQHELIPPGSSSPQGDSGPEAIPEPKFQAPPGRGSRCKLQV